MEYIETPIFLLIAASIEEFIKAYLVVLFRDTRFRVGSYLLFPALEFVSKIDDVYNHSRYELGQSELMSILAVIVVLTCSNSFHVMTSILYSKARYIWASIVYCIILHTAKNIYVYQLHTLPYKEYVYGSWLYVAVPAVFLFLYYKTEEKIAERMKLPKN